MLHFNIDDNQDIGDPFSHSVYQPGEAPGLACRGDRPDESGRDGYYFGRAGSMVFKYNNTKVKI